MRKCNKKQSELWLAYGNYIHSYQVDKNNNSMSSRVGKRGLGPHGQNLYKLAHCLLATHILNEQAICLRNSLLEMYPINHMFIKLYTYLYLYIHKEIHIYIQLFIARMSITGAPGWLQSKLVSAQVMTAVSGDQAGRGAPRSERSLLPLSFPLPLPLLI